MTRFHVKFIIYLGILFVQPGYLWAENESSSCPLTAGIVDTDDSVGVRFLTPQSGAAWAPEMRVSLDVALGIGVSADLVREHLAAGELCLSGGVEVTCFPLVGADRPSILPPVAVPYPRSSMGLVEISAWVQLRSDGNSDSGHCDSFSGNALRHVHNLSSSVYEAHVIGRRGRAFVWANAASAIPALESRLSKTAESLQGADQGKGAQVARFVGGVRFVGGGDDDLPSLWLLVGLARAQAGSVLEAAAAFGAASALGMGHPSVDGGGPRAVAASRAHAAAALATGGPGAAAAADDLISGLWSSDSALAPPAQVANEWFALLRYAMHGPLTKQHCVQPCSTSNAKEGGVGMRTKESERSSSSDLVGISADLIGAAMRAEWPAVSEALDPRAEYGRSWAHHDELEVEKWRRLVAAARFKPAIESTITDVGLTALHNFGQRNYQTRMTETEVWETAWSDAWHQVWGVCANEGTKKVHCSEYCMGGNCSMPFDMPQLPAQWRMAGSSKTNDISSSQNADAIYPPHLNLLLPMLPPTRDAIDGIPEANNIGSEEEDTATRVANYLCRKFIRPPIPSTHLKTALDESVLAADTSAADANCQWLRNTAVAPLRQYEIQVLTNHTEQSNDTTTTTTTTGTSITPQGTAVNSGRVFADLITLTDSSLAPENQFQRIYVTSLNHPHLPWRNYAHLSEDKETVSTHNRGVRSASDQKLSDHHVSTASEPKVRKQKRQKRSPWRVLVVGDSNAIVFDWAHALWGGANGWVQFDVHWVVGASAYGMKMAAATSGGVNQRPRPLSTEKSSNESAPSPPPPLRKSSRSGAAEHFASLNVSSYDAILVVLGFVDCNYVAPFRRLRSTEPATSTASPAATASAAESLANTTISSSSSSSSSRSGGHDDVETLATAANRVTAFAEAIWAQAQEFPRRKIVFLGPNPPVNTPRHQPPTVAWQDPTPHRLALTAAFSHFLRSNAERRGFKYATILEDVLDSAINQPKVRETKSDTPRMHTYMCLFICLNCGLRFLDHSFSPTCFLLTSNQTLPDLYLGEVLVYRERFRPAFERAVHCTLMAACFETAGWH